MARRGQWPPIKWMGLLSQNSSTAPRAELSSKPREVPQLLSSRRSRGTPAQWMCAPHTHTRYSQVHNSAAVSLVGPGVITTTASLHSSRWGMRFTSGVCHPYKQTGRWRGKPPKAQSRSGVQKWCLSSHSVAPCSHVFLWSFCLWSFCGSSQAAGVEKAENA